MQHAMGQMISEWAALFEERVGGLLLVSSAIMVAEFLLPRSRYSIISRVRGAIFWAVYVAITGASLILFGRLWAYVGIAPPIHLDLSFLSKAQNPILAAVGGICASLAFLQVFEFFYYWFHRAQHSSKFLWRFHAVHHSLEEMSALNSYHHFTEEIFRIPFITIPISLLFSFEQGYVPWLWGFLMGCQSTFEHSSTKLHFGWFRYVVPDNRFHRIHHSRERKHFNKNFGSGSAFWDIVFRTAHFPEKNEWPDVGLDRTGEPKTLSEFLTRPFKGDG